MKGKYEIIVQNKRIRFQFEIRRNITIVRGDSATGKTTLLELLQAYHREGETSGVKVQCEKACIVLQADTWKSVVAENGEAIFFVDECNRFITSEEFASTVKAARGYFVIVTRDNLPNLPYSVDEIYGIRTSGKYAGVKKTYNEFFHLYGDYKIMTEIHPDKIIIEDSNSGYDFYKNVVDPKIPCVSAHGKSNISAMLESEEEAILIIADGAAFGSDMERIMRLSQYGQQIVLYLPESFEWDLLRSDVLEDKECMEILRHPEDYIDSEIYFSWEQFFAKLLLAKTEGTYLQYQKQSLNPAYLHEKALKKILNVLPGPIVQNVIRENYVGNGK